ncbi:MAG: hypothetical protein NC200_05365 [Candidatus Gastranaerophilales bacterium]|nr:hypothetical protein [Candidatus Gastranaerophilales bacterium]
MYYLFKDKSDTGEAVQCAGTYRVSGYIRSDGIKVSSYERTCVAKHMGKQGAIEKYIGLKFQDLSKEELNEVLAELI